MTFSFSATWLMAGCTCSITVPFSSICGVTSSEMPLKKGCSVSVGELVVLRAKSLLAELRSLTDEVNAFQEGTSGQVMVGTLICASTSLVPLASSIAKGGELVITGASLKTAIGSNFGRGDVRITAEAQPATLITRRFIQNVTHGTLTEVSLGRDAGGNEPHN